MLQTHMLLVSALEKVFPDEKPQALPEGFVLSALRGETISFQVAYCYQGDRIGYASVQAPGATLREVVCVPCHYPAHKDRDENYLRTAPGLYPDLLQPLPVGLARLVPETWKSLWIDYVVDLEHPEGDFTLTVTLKEQASGQTIGHVTQGIHVIAVALPKQTLKNTQWFHADCLANHYGVEVFSDKHWEILRHFIKTAADHGMNMILTPHFTPPLDTAPGCYRTTTQLVDVWFYRGQYRFGFKKFRKWVRLCQECGIEYFELSHLFTQWGAAHPPEIRGAVEDHEGFQLFGWSSCATGDSYAYFLEDYLPVLIQELKDLGIESNTVFHISDEPTLGQLASYQAAKGMVAPYLEGFTIMDAISDYAFYETGAIDTPVCAVDHVEPFLKNSTPHLWTYYCTAQSADVPNRFFAMPSARNRIYGPLLFKYDIEGMLHWGYNFYNNHLSRCTIDPFLVTDGLEAFPGGDPFLVYPAKDGTALESIRLMVLHQGINDHRALELLASLKGREHVIQLMEEGLAKPLTFTDYPHEAAYLLNLRNRVNQEIERDCRNKERRWDAVPDPV